MDLGLTGERALVSGGSRGIGLATARALAREGAVVTIAARGAEALAQAAGRLAAEGLTVRTAVLDTTDDASVRSVVDGIVAELGGIDILVNTAARASGGGGTAPSDLASLRDEALREEVETKVLGYLRTARAAAPHMVAEGWGRIVNVSGMNARRTGSTFGSIRNASVVALTKNLSDELAPLGVNVTVVHPNATRTERTPGLLAELQAGGLSEEEAERRLAGPTSIGRLVTAEEIAGIIAFLASPRSVGITGDAIGVGGGVQGPIYY